MKMWAASDRLGVNGVQISLCSLIRLPIAHCSLPIELQGGDWLRTCLRNNWRWAVGNALVLVWSQNSVEVIVDVFESVIAFNHLQSRGFAAFFTRARLPKLRIEVHVNV